MMKYKMGHAPLHMHVRAHVCPTLMTTLMCCQKRDGVILCDSVTFSLCEPTIDRYYILSTYMYSTDVISMIQLGGKRGFFCECRENEALLWPIKRTAVLLDTASS